MKIDILPAEGELGIGLVGLGAVATTLIGGVELINSGHSYPTGSLTQMGTIRIGPRSEQNFPMIKDFVPLADMRKVKFRAWDPIPDDGLEAAKKAGVLTDKHIDLASEQLASVKPMPAVFDKRFANRVENAVNIKSGRNKMELAEQLINDIQQFKSECDRVVIICAGSTEILLYESEVHQSIEAFEKGLYDDDEQISPFMIYAYAAIKCGVPFANGTPGLCSDIPALVKLAELNRVPICGKDFKTGQTLFKTSLAPMLDARMLGLRGWVSYNFLGNRDGQILDEPANYLSKKESKKSVLDTILSKERHPHLYGDYTHIVDIRYYPPRGDQKEAWDNIDIFGWLDYPMQIKVIFECRDSILAAPVVLDLAMFLDLAQRAGMAGVQEWLSFYFKLPQTAPGLYPENDVFIQKTKLKNTLRYLMGVDLITHLGLEYYDELFEEILMPKEEHVGH